MGIVKETKVPCPQSTTKFLEASGVNTIFAKKGLIWTPKGGVARPLGEDEYIITSQRQLQRGCTLDEIYDKQFQEAKEYEDMRNENGAGDSD